MGTLYSDNFDADTSGSIAPGWTAITGVWLVNTTAPVSGTQAFSNTSNVDSQKAAYTAGSTSQTDQAFTISQIAGTAGYNGPVVRTDSTMSKGYLALYAAGTLHIYKFVSGSPTNLASASVSVTAGDAISIEIQAVGSTIQARMWDTTIGQTRPSTATVSTTDTSSTAGIPGVYWTKGASGVGSFDNAIWTDGTVASTAITMTGPTAGVTGTSSSGFTVAANGSIAGTLTVTMSDSGAGGSFYPSATLSLSTASPTAFVTYVRPTSGTSTISETNNQSLIDASTISYVASATSVLLPVDNAGLTWSPFNWDTLVVNDFGVPIKSMQTSTCGAYCKFKITGTTSIALHVDASQYLAPFTSANTPKLQWSVYVSGGSGGALQSAQLTPSVSPLTLATGMTSASTYEVVLYLLGASETTGDRWGTSGNAPSNSPTNIIRTQGFIVDSGASASVVTMVHPKKTAFFGDSITESIRSSGTTAEPADHGHSAAWGVGYGLNSEYAVIGYGSQGWSNTGNGNVPVFTSTWNFHSAGRARSIAAADFVFVMHGYNSALASATTSWLTAVRAVNAGAWIFVVQNPGGVGSSANATGVANYLTANPSDTKVVLIDCSDRIETYLFNGFNGANRASVDGVHPLEYYNAFIAAAIIDKAQTAMTAASGGAGAVVPIALEMGGIGINALGQLIPLL